MHALIDADILVFRCGFAAERKEWHLVIHTGPDAGFSGVFEYKREAMGQLNEALPGIHSRIEGEDFQLFPETNLEPLSHALQNVKTSVRKALEACHCTEFDAKLYLSGKNNFRETVAKTRPYKGNRDPSHRPTYEQEIRDFMMKTYDCYEAHGEEADDLMGIAQTKYGPDDSVIISLDKDLDQIPGFKYNFMHDVNYYITEEQAMYNFHMQLMTGDTTDNIVGLPGIGAGKAAKALHGLDGEEEQMAEVCRMYMIHSGKEDWLEYMTEMGQLLWIRREPGQMWQPTVDEGPDDWGQTELTLEVS